MSGTVPNLLVYFSKISILLLYLRIFTAETSHYSRITCFSAIGLNVAYYIGFVVAFTLECTPIKCIWSSNTQCHCLSGDALILIATSINIVLDLLVFLLPIPKILRLNMSLRNRLGITFVMLVGLFVTACSVVRL